jgi:hypothetical protein
VGITFAFTRDGFRSTAERKMLEWLSEKLNFWQAYLQKLVQHCREKNVNSLLTPLPNPPSSL